MGVKRYLPRSLFGRALLILVVPIIGLQAVVAVVFVQRHYDGVTSQMAGAVASELNYAVEVVEGAATVAEAIAALETLSGPLGMELGLAEGQIVDREALRTFYDVTGGVVEETFKLDVRRPMSLDLVSIDKQIDARVQTDKGVLRALIPRRRMIASNPHLLLVWTSVTALALMGVAVAFLRNQIRPIRDLAAAADAFGKGRALPFRPRGAEEVRRAGRAFLDMRARIERQMESRTRMLSGVSHDLRTPLTRMKLALAMAEEGSERDEFSRDVAEMERMLEEFLAFARGEAGEEVSAVDAAALAEEVAADARRRGARVAVFAALDDPDDAAAPMRRGVVKRALQNLLDNAAAFGDRIELSVRAGRRHVDFAIEDDGPGIPEPERETALKPFARLDAARNQNRGGSVGLGLAIAADAARTHGGSLALEDGRRLGGLRARLRLPR